MRAVVGVPAEALRVNKQHLRGALAGLTDSLMIVSEPFAVAYGMEALLHTLIIDIGAGTSDFCVMNGRYPTEEDQRTLPQAGDWVDEQLQTADRASTIRTPAFRSTWCATGRKSTVSSGTPSTRWWSPRRSPASRPSSTSPRTCRRPARVCCAPVAETMLDLLSRVDPEYQERVRNNVVLSGGTGLIRGFGGALEQALAEVGGGRVKVVKDPVFVGSDGGLAIALDAPDSRLGEARGMNARFSVEKEERSVSRSLTCMVADGYFSASVLDSDAGSARGTLKCTSL